MKKIKDFEKKLKQLCAEFDELKDAMKKQKNKIQTPTIGGELEIAGIKWTVLDHLEEGFLCIGESIGDRKFGKNNNWKHSEIRAFLNLEFCDKIENAISAELPQFKRNLLTLDGQDEYGTCMKKISMITVDEYRKYRKLLPNTGKWWWTITPDSTACNGDERFVRVVSPSGYVSNGRYYFSRGVRPLCIFPSNIFESEEE